MRTAAFYLITISIGLAIALLLAEMMLRIAGVTSTLHYLPSPYFGWSLYPNVSFTETNVANETIEVHANSRGLRDYEYAYEKPAATSRILVLGDSFTEAIQVPMDETFPKQLEQLISVGADDAGNAVQVINAGASGYGTDNALLFYTHEGHKYRPDWVILAFYIGNDVRNNSHELERAVAGGDRKPYYTVEGDSLTLRSYPFDRHSSLSTKVKLFMNRHIRLYAFVRQLRDKLRHESEVRELKTGGRVPVDLELFAKQPGERWQRAWMLTKRLIDELDGQVRSRGARLLVVLIPTEFQVYPQVWKAKLEAFPAMSSQEWDLQGPNRDLSRFLMEQEIAYIDLLPLFREQTEVVDGQLYLRGDGHWGTSGHRLASEAIARALREHRSH